MKNNYFLISFKTCLVLVGLFLATVISAQTQFVDNGIKYEVTSSSSPLTVKVIANSYTGSISIPSTVSYNSNTYNVTEIGFGAFSDSTTLTNVVISQGVTTIGDYAFKGCYNLTSVTLPSTITTIGSYSFSYIYSMPSIILPASVTTIGGDAFYACTALTSFTCLAVVPPTLGNNLVFTGNWQNNCDLLVPTGSISVYSSTDDWKDFKSISATGSLNTANMVIDKVSISPIPAKDFTILKNVTIGTTIEVYDNAGKLVFRTITKDKTQRLELNSFTSGLYWVRVNNQSLKLLISK